MLVVYLIFWLSLAVVVYAYAGYPVMIWCLSRAFGRAETAPVLAEKQLPSVTLLIAAHNEESVLRERLNNALAADYPADRFDVVVASDGSSDDTASVVASFADRGVRLLDYSERRGKSAVLNSAIAQITSDIVVLSDANTHISPDAIRNLVRWFDDPNVGVVCGRLILTDPATGTNSDGLYWRYETFLKKCESRLGALLGSNGAIYAIRRDLYVPIPSNTIVDDFVIPLLAKLQSRCEIVYDSEAVAVEDTAADVRSEFRRRSRIGAGAFQSLTMLGRLIDPRHGWLAFAFVSHKLLRWLCPFALAAMLLVSAALSGDVFFRRVFAAQLAFYAISMLVMLLPAGCRLPKALRLSSMFTGMNAALAVGFFRWLGGIQTGAWQRTPRLALEMAGATVSLPVTGGGVGMSPAKVHSRASGPRAPSILKSSDWMLAAAVALLAIGVMFDGWRDIVRLGMLKEELSYVLLAPIVIAWVAFALRDRLIDCPVRRGWAGMIILVLGWLTFWYGYWADPVLWRAGAVILAVGAVVSVVGLDVLLRLFPAFLATIFLVPVSPNGRYQLALPLQTATAQVTQTVCDILGIYVMRSGNMLSINGIDVTIAEACNGMRMILTLLMVCFVVAFTTPMKPYLRALLLLASPLVAVVANVIRLVPTIWLFGRVSRETAEAFHTVAGWIMTVLAFLFLMWTVRTLQWALTSTPGSASSEKSGPFDHLDDPDTAAGQLA